MTATATAPHLAERPPGFLARLNPLAKVAAVVPAWIGLLVTRDALVPLVLLIAAVVLLLAGARLSPRAFVLLLVGIPAGVLVTAIGFGLWAEPTTTADPTVLSAAGSYQFTTGALLVGLTTALRIAAILALALVGGLTTSGPDLARALTAQLRVPYRFAYTAVAAYRFVPLFASELAAIRRAMRVRGVAPGRGPIAAARRASAMVVPLLASSIRHADRVALTMESRAFGAHPRRTERTPPQWRLRDTVFVAVLWVVTAAVLVLR
ncbi:energy-coupling factor transporter transmembrane component T [Leifsonia sp. 1010]|uniref:energy-coupling factor transporter transmembrane component T n=1 Tax=Leifsonia sp. 1010 TaxID=2817769 RepID=UPI0028629C57|nr:energy-coupling factor transporter transmembrane component T [Leifsonia sp. 1010]MDR6611152.1 energy-coupling factor transporter transmembrane protein EcfT [Leifsonia sp. 1010]